MVFQMVDKKRTHIYDHSKPEPDQVHEAIRKIPTGLSHKQRATDSMDILILHSFTIYLSIQ